MTTVLTVTADTTVLTPLRAYRQMLLIRRFEERCLALSISTPPAMAGSLHFCAGQEAIPVGAMAAIDGEDRVVATYRGHGWALERGIPVDELLAECCHRASGVNGGRAGSPYVMAPWLGFVGENSIVGAGVPIAAGAALASVYLGAGRIAVVSFGDGAVNQGALHEGIAFAAARRLPVVLVCENNGWSEMTPISETVPFTRLADRANGYGIPAVTIDGCDPFAVRDAIAEAAARARQGEGPTFVECDTVRLMAHYNRDIEHYRPSEDLEAARLRDPIPRARVAAEASTSAADVADVEHEVERLIDSATERALAAPLPDPGTARLHVVSDPRPSARGGLVGTRLETLTFGQAVNRALNEELEARPEVLVFGEDVGAAGGIFGVTRGLQKTFGAERVFDTPISESAILGAALGSSLEGLKPIVEVMWADFLLVALDQLVNQAANVRYVTSGRASAPFVVRTQQGATPGSCAQHSQSLEALLAHVPGLRVGLPATAQDAYSMLRAAVGDDDPCVIIEARALYPLEGDVDLDLLESVGGARMRRSGADAVIITWGTMLHRSLEAASLLAAEGIEVGVLDLRWLAPLDEAAIAEAVRSASGRVVIVHEANRTGGFGAEVAAGIAESLLYELDAPVLRVATPDVRMPAAPGLQAALVPSAEMICQSVRQLVGAPTESSGP